MIDRPSAQLLGSHVSGSAEDGAGARQRRRDAELQRRGRRGAQQRQPEVEDFGSTVGCDHDVAGLEVAVDHTAVMGRGERVD